jgi:lipopolysaccharide biosynthesis glycosyltransferase
MRTRTKRSVVLACDESYQPAACVCLTSLFLNSPDVDFITYLVTDAPNQRLSDAARRLADVFGRDIKIAVVGADALQRFSASLGPIGGPAYISRAAFLRLALPELLSDEAFVYLDCDIVVQDSIAPLLQLELGDSLAAAAGDGLNAANGRKHLRFAPDEPYINTGVLVVNARAWRATGGLGRVGQICHDHRGKLGAADQDIVNLFCRGRKKLLDRRWNTLQHDFLFSGDWSSFDPETFRGIFHFCSEIKPWMAWSPEPPRRLYLRYAALAPWRMPEVTAPRNDRERKVQAMTLQRERLRARTAAPQA